ncbi:MAG: CDP-alcohol phosphatidyltransferase family protein [Chlorobiota bacterium]|jgi:cardiolipin synthase|nr:MAG: CDP-alcohol phosphatidyltransferase family protein [Chlorobiota bacterium]
MRHLPNILSSLRLALTIPLVWAITRDERVLAFSFGFAALVSDALDGMIARQQSAESELGRLLDPLADKVLAASVALALLVRQMIPLWYVAAVIGRDLLIVVGGFVLRRRIGAIPPSLPIGKAAATSIGVVLLAAIAGVPSAVLAGLAGASSVLLLWSLVVYAARLRRALRP